MAESTTAKFRVCRRCQERTYDFDAEERAWYCDSCDDWADL